MKVYVNWLSSGSYSEYSEWETFITLDKELALKKLDEFIAKENEELIKERFYNSYKYNFASVREYELDSDGNGKTIKEYRPDYGDYTKNPIWVEERENQ